MVRRGVVQLVFLTLSFVFLDVHVGAQVIDLDVKGVRIQSSYTKIVRSFGPRLRDEKMGEVPCRDGGNRTLRYEGLTAFLEVGGERPFGLYKAEVVSRRWPVSGIRVGDDINAVFEKFGRSAASIQKGRRYISYPIRDGVARFYFSRNRVTKIEWEFNFC